MTVDMWKETVSDTQPPAPARTPTATQHSYRQWTRAECEDLVAGLRAGADIRMLALAHQRSATAIRRRLMLMVPVSQRVWDYDVDTWLRQQLSQDPDYDWLSVMRERGAEPGEEEPDRSVEDTPRVRSTGLSSWTSSLARTTPLNTTPGRYKPADTLLQFLESL